MIRLEDKQSIRLTSAEVAHLWNTYMSDSMAICVLSYFLIHIQDTDIKPIIEKSLNLSKKHVNDIQQLFKKEGYTIPQGFTERDLNMNAPALFYDTFYVHYLKQMSRIGINAYGLGLSIAARKDIRKFYESTLFESIALDNDVTSVLLNKGLYIRAPFINAPEKVEFVDNNNFLGGLIGHQRPLLGMEIAHLYGNMETASMGKALCIAFSQVSKTNEVTKLLLKLRDKAGKNIESLGSKLEEGHLRVPMTWIDTVTDSTVAPFSDKLMLFHINAVMATAVADYGISLAASARKDLSLMYTVLITGLGGQIEDGAKIMIQNGWLEKPPSATDRDALASK